MSTRHSQGLGRTGAATGAAGPATGAAGAVTAGSAGATGATVAAAGGTVGSRRAGPAEIDSVEPQGGDPRHRPPSVEVDLSTCVSRYGPPPAALQALREAPARLLRHHPYGAAQQLTEAYGRYLGVPPSQLVAARGASELIWQLACSPWAAEVAVPMPAYTEYRQAFPSAAVGTVGVHHRLELIAELLCAGRVVLLSNPHNPSGRAFSAVELADVLHGSGGRGVLVVDESYVEFADQPGALTLVGADFGNLVVLRSPSKFFGVAGARVGVAWSADPELLAAFTVRRGSWPVSALEVAPVVAGLADDAWQVESHRALRADTAWLDDQVVKAWGEGVVGGAVTHFRLVCTPDAPALAVELASSGVGVRLLGRGHGLAGPAFRIAAPSVAEYPLVKAALSSAGGRHDSRK